MGKFIIFAAMILGVGVVAARWVRSQRTDRGVSISNGRGAGACAGKRI